MTMIETHVIEARTHGRYVVRVGQTFLSGQTGMSGPHVLVGFHGYAENAEKHLAELETIAGAEWTLVAVQALNRFYTRNDEIVANWMTRQDREHAIADNIDYVRRVVEELRPFEKLVFAGFSQGVAMAYRAAAAISCDGVIALARDLPREIAKINVPIL